MKSDMSQGSTKEQNPKKIEESKTWVLKIETDLYQKAL